MTELSALFNETATEDMGVMWRLDLICCGREDGHVVRDTWAEADKFRQSYDCDSTPQWGHERRSILVADHAHTGPCNGYSDDCPLPGGSFLEVIP